MLWNFANSTNVSPPQKNGATSVFIESFATRRGSLTRVNIACEPPLLYTPSQLTMYVDDAKTYWMVCTSKA